MDMNREMLIDVSCWNRTLIRLSTVHEQWTLQDSNNCFILTSLGILSQETKNLLWAVAIKTLLKHNSPKSLWFYWSNLKYSHLYIKSRSTVRVTFFPMRCMFGKNHKFMIEASKSTGLSDSERAYAIYIRVFSSALKLVACFWFYLGMKKREKWLCGR